MSDRTLSDSLRATAGRVPDRDAVITEERTLTYRELDEGADRVAAWVAASGLERGDRVAVELPNSADAALAILGVLRSGAAISLISPAIKRDKLAYILADCGARALICDEERAETARAASEGSQVVALATDREPFEHEGDPPPGPLSVDLAAVIYTSGSTGEPKGVTLSHANMAFVADSIAESLTMREDDRVLCVLQLSFGYGLYQLLTSVVLGASLVLEPGFAFAGRIVELLENERITIFPGVPTVFQVLLSLRGLGERELPGLRLLTNAGAGLPEATGRALRELLPNADLCTMYGQTEAQRICCMPPGAFDARPTSSGIAIPGTEAWVEDDEGNLLAPGEVGELHVRGAHIMQGYWAKDELTATKLRSGRWPWERTMATGDLFRIDEEGFLYFVARQDDIFKSRGEKVVPREVEEVIHAVAGVREAAVVPSPDRLLGDAVHAHVAPLPDAEIDVAAVRRACAERLEDHMIPKKVIVHEQLPRLDSGKVDKRSLAAPAQKD
jgi:amino acid adenylation domain-containing protein